MIRRAAVPLALAAALAAALAWTAATASAPRGGGVVAADNGEYDIKDVPHA
ncbi:hypothetical protein [Thermocatellispora tengchongensis]